MLTLRCAAVSRATEGGYPGLHLGRFLAEWPYKGLYQGRAWALALIESVARKAQSHCRVNTATPVELYDPVPLPNHPPPLGYSSADRFSDRS